MVAVGAPVFRQYPYEPGPFVEAGTRVAVVSRDPAEVHRSPVELAVLAPPAAVCAELAGRVPRTGRGAAHAVRAARAAGASRREASRCAPDTCSPRSPSGCPRDAS